MPGRSYRLSPQAETDLEQIWLHSFTTWSLEQADGYLASIVAAMEGLASGEKRGRRADVRDGYFKYAVGSHLIFYRQPGESIDVIRVLHQAMDVDRHLKSL